MKKIFLILVIIYSQLAASDWKIMYGKYVTLEFKPNLYLIADSLVNIADRAIPRLSALHGLPLSSFDEQKTRIILTDAPDIPNGFAIENAVVIYARSSMLLNVSSGPHSWYRRVLEHELVHHITFRSIERTESYFGILSSLSTPRWLFEGLAQYFAETWTAYRGDIFMREAVLNGQLKYNSLFDLNNGRLLYASGHAFVRYLADQHGDSSLIKLVNHNKNGFFYNFNKAFKEVYKRTPQQEYKYFVRHMVTYYGNIAADYALPQFKNILPGFGFYDLQIIPLNNADSTYLVSAVASENHLFKTAAIFQIEKGIKKVVKEITNNFVSELLLNNDQNLVAFGTFNLGADMNQLAIDFKWHIYDRSADKITTLPKNIRSFNAAFTNDNNLLLAESRADCTSIIEISLDDFSQKKILTTDMAVGKFISLENGHIIFEAQNTDNIRDLYLWNGYKLIQLSKDEQQNKNPLFINDSLLAISQEVDNHPVISIFNLKSGKAKVVLNDQFPLLLKSVRKDSNQIIISYPDPLGKQVFVSFSIDSILEQPVLPLKYDTDNVFSTWTKRIAIADSMEDSQPAVLRTKKTEDMIFPQAKLINIQTIPIPIFTEDNYGLFLASLWTEALSRQTIILSSYLVAEDWQNSFISFLHEIKMYNLSFSTVYYHGPGFITRIDDKYQELIHDYALFDVSYLRFFGGNARLPYNFSISYLADRFQKKDLTLDYSYHGPVISTQFGYNLPSKYSNIFPKRSIMLSAGYFKSFRDEWDFSAFSTSLKIGSNIFLERLGIQSRFNYTQLAGNVSPSAETGIDRDFEYNLPRDFRNTRTLRGINNNIFGKSLLWSSSDLSFVVAERTPLKLIFIPINEVAAGAFFDVAKVSSTELYSYGAELSFGLGILRFSSGYAKGNINGEDLKAGFYGRISLIVEDVFRGLTTE